MPFGFLLPQSRLSWCMMLNELEEEIWKMIHLIRAYLSSRLSLIRWLDVKALCAVLKPSTLHMVSFITFITARRNEESHSTLCGAHELSSSVPSFSLLIRIHNTECTFPYIYASTLYILKSTNLLLKTDLEASWQEGERRNASPTPIHKHSFVCLKLLVKYV